MKVLIDERHRSRTEEKPIGDLRSRFQVFDYAPAAMGVSEESMLTSCDGWVMEDRHLSSEKLRCTRHANEKEKLILYHQRRITLSGLRVDVMQHSRKEKTLQSHRREDVRTIGRPSNIVQTMTLLRAHVYERIKVMLPKEVLKWWKHFTAVPVLASG